MRPTAAALLLFALAPLCGLAAPADPRDRIDAYVTAEMKREHIPGLALGIYRRGEILKAQGYGLANVELDVPVKPETIFQSGSVGKQFAATAIMMLVEEGKIDLEDSVTKYFDRAPEIWKPVKVKNCCRTPRDSPNMKPMRAPSALSICDWTARKPSSSTRSPRYPWIFGPARNGGIRIPIT